MPSKTTTTRKFIEYVVNMHDVDAAMNVLARVWVRDPAELPPDYLPVETRAENVCAQMHAYLFGSNTVEYTAEEPTGLIQTKTVIIEESGESSYKDEDFYKMTE